MNKRKVGILIILLFFALIVGFFFLIGLRVREFAFLFIWIFVFLVFLLFFRAYFVPGKWFFKNRYSFDGMLIIIGTLFFIGIINKEKFSIESVILKIVVGSIIGFIMGYFNKRSTEKRINKNINIAFDQTGIILSDMASWITVDGKNFGKMALTGEKLKLFPYNTESPYIEKNISEIRDQLALSYKFGIPNGFSVGNDLKISLSYPRMWVKRIKETV